MRVVLVAVAELAGWLAIEGIGKSRGLSDFRLF